MVTVEFESGTLVIDGPETETRLISKYCKYDARIGCLRAKAIDYAAIIMTLHRAKAEYEDKARNYNRLELPNTEKLNPRPYQQEAITSWSKQSRRGVVVLPTGSGKSFVARMAIESVGRPTLVIVPTIDLLQQWTSQLEKAFNQPVGMLGGGSKDIQNITVSTYDSAVLMMEFIGNKFGLLIVDECHHLPGPVNRSLAEMCIAPFRLGLTATPEREDGGEQLLYNLLGPMCYQVHIDELEGDVLAPYETIRMELDLDEDEQVSYDTNREIYKNFLNDHNITFRGANDWARFLILTSQSPQGKKAFKAFMEQKRIARAGRAKFRAIWSLLKEHAEKRCIIFTADNPTAYEIGRRFYLPVLTHHTKAAERKKFLDKFRTGEYPVLVTSRVLNEGIDVPEAGVAIVVSGTGSTREHVQRLGRILRPSAGKAAVLYELISAGTSEYYISDRRRQHRAYKKSDTV